MLTYQEKVSFLAGNQSAKHFTNLKRGEFTPFAKGDFSHLIQGLFGITTRDRIEFFESIKGKIIEFCESIKKGSQSATLGNVDIKYRASENINTSLLLWYGKYQPFGSIPNRSNSLRHAALTHALNDVSAEAVLICSSNSSSNLIIFVVLPERSKFLFCFLSCIGIYRYVRLFIVGLYHITSRLKRQCLVVLSTLTRHLITTDKHTIEVTMKQHNTPVTGRTSLTPNQSYRWLFLALNRSDYTAKPCRIAVTAPNENSARLMLVRDYILSFAGRLPAQEVTA